MIESHGQIFTSYDCPSCGAKSRREIDARICQKKHELRQLLIEAHGQDWKTMFTRGGDRFVATDHADEIKQRKARKVKPLRGERIPEGKL